MLHAGLAFGASHRYVYKPFKQGRLPGRAVIRAGVGGLFAHHEAKLAFADARSGPLLSRLVLPSGVLQGKGRHTQRRPARRRLRVGPA